jgi:hypothetical protein
MDELPYFDSVGNDYVKELNRQDAYMRRGGRLTAPQQIKYENRVAMLAERLALIHTAILSDPEALQDYLHSVEQTRRLGVLPLQVYSRFMDQIKGKKEESTAGSERDRDRLRVIRGEQRHDQVQLSDLSVEDILDRHQRQTITDDVLFQQFQKREKAGIKLPKIDSVLWSKYRTWVGEQRRMRRSRNAERPR